MVVTKDNWKEVITVEQKNRVIRKGVHELVLLVNSLRKKKLLEDLELGESVDNGGILYLTKKGVLTSTYYRRMPTMWDSTEITPVKATYSIRQYAEAVEEFRLNHEKLKKIRLRLR